MQGQAGFLNMRSWFLSCCFRVISVDQSTRGTMGLVLGFLNTQPAIARQAHHNCCKPSEKEDNEKKAEIIETWEFWNPQYNMLPDYLWRFSCSAPYHWCSLAFVHSSDSCFHALFGPLSGFRFLWHLWTILWIPGSTLFGPLCVLLVLFHLWSTP